MNSARTHPWRRRLAVALSCVLASGVLVTAPLAAASGAWTSKVDDAVLQASAAGPTDFIVYLEAKADLSAADAASTKAQRGWFVFDALTTTARESQAPLVELLEDAGARYRSFWISNSLVVTGDLELVEALAKRADVRAVYAVGKGELQEPVDVPAGTDGSTSPEDTDSTDGTDSTAVADATDVVGPSIAHVRAPEAWELGYRGQGVVVAGADTGVRWTHSAIKRQYRGWDDVAGTADHDYNWHNAAGPNAACPLDDSQPCDDHDHGTHTVGTIVGDDGGANQIGVAPDAEWIACRNMNQGVGAVPTYMDCMQWFIAPTDLAGNNPDPAKAPDVVNNSWGCVEVCAPPMLKDMIDASRAAGIVYVVSAGNDNQFFLGLTMACNTINFPLAVYDAAFTVGATGATDDNIASFSSLGPVAANPTEGVAYRKPDITAPGEGIRSSVSGNDNAYANFSGTSMAGPHVAGLVALIISANPELRGRVDTIEQIIRETAVPRTSDLGCGGDSSTAVPNNVYGWGRIDAAAAVQRALETDPAPVSTRELAGLPAQVVDATHETGTQDHPTTDFSTGAAVSGTTTWRVVKDTGNCCENHVTTSSDGRLFDIGGRYVNYTDDLGLTWKSVRPIDPVVNAEGSIAMAPNGDVIAMTWDAYSGDRFVAYKYNADTGEWRTLMNVVHQPFYDRPWISVVPGPFIDPAGKAVPYISIVQGGTGIKDPMFISFDGLLYAEPSSLNLGDLTSEAVTGFFPISADPSFDWIQPIRRAPVTGLGGGFALANGGYQLDPETREWHPWRLPDGSVPPTFIQVDSAGRIHHVRSAGEGSLEYRISADGGRTWTSAVVPLPLGGLVDFKVNRAVGISAVALRLDHQDWVYKFDITGDTAELLRRYRVGLGDNPAGSSIGALTSPRMDFQTVAIFPDGRVAVSFLDSTTFSHPPGTGMLGRITPALAIELDTSLPQPDLQVTDITVSDRNPRAGQPAVISATVANTGGGSAGASETVFRLGDTPLGSVAIPSLGPDSATTVELAWDTRGQNGDHVIGVTADAAGTVPESDEANNSATLEVSVRGNKVQNGDFEQAGDGGETPSGWTADDTASGETGYADSGGTDGSRGATITGTGASTLLGGVATWTSAAIDVAAGEVLDLRVSVSATGLSSAPGVGLAYLGAAGELLETVRLLDVPLLTEGFTTLEQQVTLPPGVSQVRVVLFGFSVGDLATAGTVTFDDVGLYGP